MQKRINSRHGALVPPLALVLLVSGCAAAGGRVPASRVNSTSATTVLWTYSTNEVNKPAAAVEGRTTRAQVEWDKDYKLSIVVDNIGGLRQLHAKTSFIAQCATQPLNDQDTAPPAWPGTYSGELESFDGPPAKAADFSQDLVHSVTIPTFKRKDKCGEFTDASGNSRVALVTGAEYSVALSIVKANEVSENGMLTLELKP